MPTFEMVMILRKMAKPELKTIVKRTAGYFFNVNCVVRGIEYLGFMKTPYRIKSLTEANYFVFRFESSETKLNTLRDKLKRDTEISRFTINFIENKFNFKNQKNLECDIATDLLDVPFRPHVQKMVEMSKKNSEKSFNYGWDKKYDPIGN